MRFVTVIATSICLQSSLAVACSVDVDAVVFGNIEVSRDNTADGKITLDCPAAAVFALSIRSANDGADRLMIGPNGVELVYQLFVDPGFIQPWGDGGATGAAVGGSVAAGSVTEFSVYGRIPSQNQIPAGDYRDLPIVTLLY